MAVILSIETSTSVCSVALSKDGDCLVEKTHYDGPSHATKLPVFIKEMLDFAAVKNLSPDAIAVSCGPGSYTGLRIGVSTAKGLCFGYDIPLIAINTLQIMASTVIQNQQVDANTILCPMIDARRMEVYTAFFNNQLETVRKTSADIIEENSYDEQLNKQTVLFFGNGAEKCKTTLKHSNAVFLNDIHPIAKNMITLAEASFKTKIFEDVAYFEPFYLKEFVATTAKEKLKN